MYTKTVAMLTSASLALYAGTGLALSQSFNADDVIRFYSEQVDHGPTRKICIGTKDECNWDAERPKEKKGFNLTVTFEFGSTNLTGDAKLNLDQYVLALKDDRLARARFSLEGHTDAVGSETANHQLSEQRARSVARYLVAQGVDLARLEIVGFGESRLANPDDPGHDDNRRVEARMILE